MQIRELQTDYNLQHGAHPRTPGMHVSECIRSVALDMGMYKGDDKDELDWTLIKYRMMCGQDVLVDYPLAIRRVAFGLAWEQWYGGQHPEMNFHQVGELKKDGLIGTPDGLEYRTVQMVQDLTGTYSAVPGRELSYGIIHEIKATWKSSRSHNEAPLVRISKEWAWLSQIKSYCYMAHDSRWPVLTGILHVYWVNGGYRGGGPEINTYELTFTEAELAANWRLITNTAKHLQERERRDGGSVLGNLVPIR